MRIVIAGEDETVIRLAEVLMEGHEVAVVCPEAARSTRLERLDLEVVYGSIAATSVLRRAGTTTGELFVAASSVDENNLLACVTARQLGASRTICFLYHLDFDTPKEDRLLLAERLGIDEVVVPAEQLAEEILRIVEIPGALEAEVFLGGQVHLLRHAVEEGSPIAGTTLRDLGLPPGVVLVMGRRGDDRFLPRGDTRFLPGDQVTAMGTRGGVNRLLRNQLQRRGHGPELRRATVVGGGGVGLAVARGLEDAGWTVKIIEADRARCDAIAPLVRGLVLHGDGTDLDLLESERIGDDAVLVAVTSHDEKNLLVSLLARELGVSRVLTRVDQQPNERLFERVGIDVVLSARGAAVRTVLRSVGHTKADLLAELEHGDAYVLEIDVPAGAPPLPLAEMRTDLLAIVGAVLRGDRVLVPRGADAVRGGDRLLVFCARENEAAVRDFFTRQILERT